MNPENIARLITEDPDVNNIFPDRAPAPSSVDDTTSLVARRFRFKHNQNATKMWLVTHCGQPLSIISDQSTRWVHEKFEFGYFDWDEQNILTSTNRDYLDSTLRNLALEIKAAIKEKRADVVSIPVDINKIGPRRA